MKKIRFAIIGCGVIAPNHANAVLLDDRSELVAVCDIIIEKASIFAERFHVNDVYVDYNEMLKREDIDAVCICVPSGIHSECVIACAKNNKNIMCEKPLDIHVDTMTQMINAVKESNVTMGCIFQNRTMPGFKKAKQMLDNGELGRIVIAECQYRGYRSPEYYASAGWRGTWEIDGGGCLMNQGIHAVDTLLWLVGDVKSIYANATTLLRDIEVEDTANALLEFKNGAMGVIMGTTLSNVSINSPEGDYFRIECEKGSIVYDNGEMWMFTREKDDLYDSNVGKVSLDEEKWHSSASSASDPTQLDNAGHSILISDFITSLIENKQPYITGDSARKGVDIVLGIYESSRTGKKIYL